MVRERLFVLAYGTLATASRRAWRIEDLRRRNLAGQRDAREANCAAAE